MLNKKLYEWEVCLYIVIFVFKMMHYDALSVVCIKMKARTSPTVRLLNYIKSSREVSLVGN